MNLPPEIPEYLKSLAVSLPGVGPDDWAWNRQDSLNVIESLRGTKIAILSGDVYRAEAWGFVPVYANWNCGRIKGETASEYAQRSRGAAARFIESYREDPGGKYLYLLVFSTQQEAA